MQKAKNIALRLNSSRDQYEDANKAENLFFSISVGSHSLRRQSALVRRLAAFMGLDVVSGGCLGAVRFFNEIAKISMTFLNRYLHRYLSASRQGPFLE